MSRFDYTPIGIRQSREAARVNTIYADFEAAGNAINTVNQGTEGYDRIPFVASPQGEVVANVTEDVRDALPAAALFTLFSQNGTNFQTPGITLDANDILRVYARVYWESTIASGVGLPKGRTFEIQIGYDDGGPPAVLTHSRRPWRTSSVVAADANQHGTLETLGFILGPKALNFVELQYLYDGVVDMFPSVSVLECVRFRRVL